MVGVDLPALRDGSCSRADAEVLTQLRLPVEPAGKISKEGGSLTVPAAAAWPALSSPAGSPRSCSWEPAATLSSSLRAPSTPGSWTARVRLRPISARSLFTVLQTRFSSRPAAPGASEPGGPPPPAASPELLVPPPSPSAAGRRPSTAGGLPLPPLLHGLRERRRSSGQVLRRIARTADVERSYKLGKRVRAQARQGTDLRFGTNRLDGSQVVIKIRRKWGISRGQGQKDSAFFSAQDEEDWRAGVLLVLNLVVGSQHLASINEVLEDRDAFYVVMERCHGVDLFELLRTSGRSARDPSLSPTEIRQVIRQLLQAVAALHESGCIHRDLKLDNLMVDRDGLVNLGAYAKDPSARQEHCPLVLKVVDFDDVCTWPLPADAMAGKPVVGTDQYIPPEAYAGHYSPASDIFSVGVILFRLIMGRFPFEPQLFNDVPGENWVGAPKMEAIRAALLKAEIDWQHQEKGMRPPDPSALAMCKAMLSMSPAERPSAAALLALPWLHLSGAVPPSLPPIGGLAGEERGSLRGAAGDGGQGAFELPGVVTD